MKKATGFLVAISVVALLGAALLPVTAAAKAKKGPVVVGTDPADDFGGNVDATLAPLGDALGMELVEAAIEPKDAKTLNFIIKLNSLPASGGVPELARYVWTMTVDDELLQVDGKFTNYSRGACDPTAGTCPPPRDPGQAPFAVRGDCTDNGGAAVTCEEIGSVNATFDAAEATITIPVPLELLGAKPGSKIANGTQAGSNFSGVWAIPSAFVSQGNMPLDALVITKTYKVPKK
jgi:hypothetical protein